MNNKQCLICKRSNNTLHWHKDAETGNIWVYCVGKCQRGYGLRDYCHTAGVNLNDFLKGDFDFTEAKPNEVSRLEWPSYYIPMSDPRAEEGVAYVKSRSLDLKGDMYFDLKQKSIVFPYYYGGTFVGAQLRLLNPWVNEDGDEVKVLTMPGSRLGLLFYNWNQEAFITEIKGVVVCEGAFNVLALQQSLDKMYGGVIKNPWKVVATSGCGTTSHQIDRLKELKDAGIKVVCAFDSDESGLKGLKKLIKEEAVTHYALCDDTKIDWNDKLQELGHEGLSKYFLSRIKRVQ